MPIECPLFVHLAYQCSFLFVCFVDLYAGHPYIHLISFEIFLLALYTTSAILMSISTNASTMSTSNHSTTLPVSSSPLYVQDNAIILATVAPILAILMISTTILVTIIVVVFLRRNCKKSRIVQHPAAALSTIADDQAVDLELQENYCYQQYVLQSQLIMRMFSVITFAPHKLHSTDT